MTKDSNRLEENRYLKIIDKELQNLPFFVKEYRLMLQHSTATQYQYLTEFRRFFDWLRSSGLTNASSNRTIDLATLEQLKNIDMMCYIDFLKHHRNRQGKYNSSASINRSLNALRSLFHYLSVTAEDKNGEPYLKHNVMLKVKQLKAGATLNARARVLEKQMYCGDQKYQWLDFIANDYEKTLTLKQEITRFHENKTRDLALIATLLGSAGRRSEIANLDIKDIELNDAMINLKRKGGALDSVPLANWTLPYIRKYWMIRQQQYKQDKTTKALFVTQYQHHYKRISAEQINNIVKKYSKAYGRPSTAHKMRHTTASELFQLTKDEMLVAQQLGQHSTSATHLYTHINSKQQKDAMSKLK